MVEGGRAYRAVVEAIGLFGVIGSLTFVGLEVRQSTIATRSANDMAVADEFQSLNLALAQSPALAHALVAVEGGNQTATPEEMAQTAGFYRALIHTWSNAYRQHVNGTLDPDLWASVVQEMSAYAENAPAGTVTDAIVRRGRLARGIWEGERFLYSPDFQKFADKTMGIKR
jgi:hypothetical protein